MEFLFYGVAILLSSIASIAGSAPNIHPAGYNASLNEDEMMDFRCIVANDTINAFWLINGFTVGQLGQEALAERGITYSDTLITEDDSTFVVIRVQARAENDYTTLQCVALSPEFVLLRSEVVVFRVQGLLDPPTGLTTAYLDFSHDALMWEDPYTLDLTGSGPDITGYTVTIVMEHPPPLFPYDHSVMLAELAVTSSQTFSVSSAEDQQRFLFLRYAFPVWLSVSAENAAGLGNMSQYFKYTNQPQSDCMRISDSVVSQPASKVTFVNSTSYLEITLFQLPSENGADYCFDTVAVNVSDSDGAVSQSHTLVPRLSGTAVIVELASGQEQDTHFTASLFFNSQHIATTDFSTYDVQDVSLSPLPNGLMVQCVFAGGSTDDVCIVVLVLDNEVVMVKDVVRGVGGEFSNLANGTYTVLVYDSGADMEGSGEENPAVETTIAVTGEPDSPTTATGTSTSATDPSSSPTSGPTDDESGSGSSGGIGRFTLYIVIAIAAVCVSVLVLIAVLIVFKRYRNKASNYSVKKRESCISGGASNPLQDTSELEMKDPNYSEIPTSTGPRPSNMVAIGMESVAEDVGYEVVDADKARERRAKKMEKKTEAVPAPVASVYTEEEIQELRRHTYSTVNKDKSVKRKTARQDSSPPPIPPQTFDTQYAEELLRDGQSLEEQVKIDLAVEDHDSHIYDSLHPTTSPVGSPFHSNGVQPSPPHLPPKHVSQVVAGPMYDSIKSPPLLVPVHSPHQPSPTPSPTDDRDNSRLIQSSPPQLPPKSSTVAHVDPMYDSIKSTPSKSRPAISGAHFGSHHSVTNGVAAGGPALRHGWVGTAPSSQRPHSMLVHQSSADTHSAMLSAAASFSLDRRMTRRMTSMPLLTSNLQHDV